MYEVENISLGHIIYWIVHQNTEWPRNAVSDLAFVSTVPVSKNAVTDIDFE